MPLLSFTAIVIEKKYLTDDVIFLALTHPPNFNFKAGQFLSLKIIGKKTHTITGSISHQGQKEDPPKPFQMKSYSIFSPPKQKNKLDFIIKLIPGGYASEVFRATNVGDQFEAKGPLGHFFFDESVDNFEQWFIGAGTGITPLHSMIVEHLEQHPRKVFKLIYGARSRKTLFYHTEFEEMELRHPNFEYLPTLSRDDWEGAKGRVQVHLRGDLSDKTFYICGLKELIVETKDLLLKNGVKQENIHFERFN